MTNRPYVKFQGTTDEAVLIAGGRQVTFLADPTAKLTRTTGSGAIVTVQDDGTSLGVYDLSISNAPNSASGVGLVIPTASGAPKITLVRVIVANNPGGGISASGGSLTLTQSTVSGNTGGGISISGAQFTIANNFVTKNGGLASLVGGIDISQISTAGINHLDFNTIAANGGNASVNSGVNCSTVVVPLVFDSNIIYDNIVSGGGMQLGGSAMCSATYSDVGPGAAAGPNISSDPMFINASQNNFHLMSNSPAKDAADPNATLARDFDGDTRPQGTRRDMGADEIMQ